MVIMGDIGDKIFNKHLKKFFSFPGVQKAVNEDNFDEVFNAWDRYRNELRKEEGIGLDFNHLLTYRLCSFLEKVNIDWLSMVTRIPNYAFWYYSNSSINIPNSIEKIGDFCFRNSKIDTINYNGTKGEWEKIHLGIDSLRGKHDEKIKIICSDGDIL